MSNWPVLKQICAHSTPCTNYTRRHGGLKNLFSFANMVNDEHPLVIWGKLPGEGDGVRIIIFSETKTDILKIDGTLWRQKTKTVFLSQTDFIQFLTPSPPTQTWAKRFGLIRKKTQKSGISQIVVIFLKIFNPWFPFFLFWNQHFMGRVRGKCHFLKSYILFYLKSP